MEPWSEAEEYVDIDALVGAWEIDDAIEAVAVVYRRSGTVKYWFEGPAGAYGDRYGGELVLTSDSM